MARHQHSILAGTRHVLAILATGLAVGVEGAHATPPGAEPAPDPRYGLLTPISEQGDTVPIVDRLYGPTQSELARRAQISKYRQQIRAIAHRCFGRRPEALREMGLAELTEFTDPAAFLPLIEELRDEDDPIRLAMLDHLAGQGEQGQAALAWVAAHETDALLRNEAQARLTSPASRPVLAVLEDALRSGEHQVVANAGVLSGALGALETIPLLISAQVTQTPRDQTGDLAWIAVQKQTVYVQRLDAVAGNAAGAFQPVLGVLTEGFVFRVQDAVVVIYNASVHNALVALTSRDWGQSTADLGYDRTAWIDWYNTEYLPFKNEQAIIDELARDPSDPAS